MTDVTGPDGAVHVFPDDTPPDVITNAMRQHYGPPKPAQSESFQTPLGPRPVLSTAATAEDTAKATAAGAARGSAALGGLPGDISRFADWGPAWLMAHGAEKLGLLPQGKTAEDFIKDAQSLDLPRDNMAPPTSSELVDQATKAAPAIGYKAQSIPGEVGGAIGEIAPSVIAGPGSALKKAASATLGGLAQTGVEHSPLAGTPYEVPAKMIATGLGVAAPHVSSIVGPSRVLRETIEGVTPQNFRQAEELMQRGLTQNPPIKLSWDEALNHVTNGRTKLADIRRVVESSRGGGALREMMAERPEAIKEAGRNTIAGLRNSSSIPPTPAQLGPQVSEAAQGDIKATQAGINQATRPLYTQASSQRVGPDVQAALMSDPLYKRAFDEVRANPELNVSIAKLPDDSVGVIDLVQRRLKERSENAAVPGQPSSSNLAAANLSASRTAPIAAAETVTGSRAPMVGGLNPRVVGSYEQARAEQARLRQEKLTPLVEGPTGELAGTTDVTKQGAALFPENPATESERDLRRTMQGLIMQNPRAAEDIVHSHLQTTFDKATKKLQGGDNAYGGANFAKAVMGNDQAAKNLKAVIESLPDGRKRYQGLRTFLDLAEATGRAPRQGSATAFNQEMQRELKAPGAHGVLTPFKTVHEFFDRARMKLASRDIARMLTDPRAAAEWRALSQANPNSIKTVALAARIIARAENSRKEKDNR